MGKKNILMIEDEVKISEVVSSYLEHLEYHVLLAENGKDAMDILVQEPVILILLDLMLPDITGEELCKSIRQKMQVPIIMLTAKSEEEDLLLGLKSGADDYITKPFSLKELGARIEAVLRRCSQNQDQDPFPSSSPEIWEDRFIMVDFNQNLIKKGEEIRSLTPSESKILSVLIKYPQKVFTRDELIDLALGSEFYGYDRAVDTHIKNIRQKIEDNPRSPVYIKTIFGKGYKFGGQL